jgi:predicted SAM-dependent methyltransferase
MLEYFDEKGQFHPTAWNVEAGFVERSEHHDPRNQERPLAYTSLIVDCIPLSKT